MNAPGVSPQGQASHAASIIPNMTMLPPVDLVGVGLNATDTLIPLARFPERGSKVEYSGGTIMPGGQTATAVIACRQWGMRTRYVGKLGDDDAARLHREAFDKAGVDAQLVTVRDAASPQSLILVDAGGERTVLCRRDERLVLQPADLDRQWIAQARLLHVDGYDTAAAALAADWAHAAGIPVIADLDEPYAGVEALIRNVDHLIVSRDFPCRLAKTHDLELALKTIHARFGCAVAAATLGHEGVLAWDGKQMLHRAAYRVSVVDTTGAGDIFHAGFIYGLHRSWPLARQLDFACAAAALNCTGVGARGAIRPVEEIERLMAEAPRYDTACLSPLLPLSVPSP